MDLLLILFGLPFVFFSVFLALDDLFFFFFFFLLVSLFLLLFLSPFLSLQLDFVVVLVVVVIGLASPPFLLLFVLFEELVHVFLGGFVFFL